MNILEKFKETALSVLPVIFIVLVLGLTILPLGGVLLVRFCIGALLLILGLTIFLLGVDLGIQPMGERCGAALTKRLNMKLLLGTAFVVGIVVTVAEPDIQVFGDQVNSVFPDVGKISIILAIAFGVGLFMALGIFRSVASFSLKKLLFVSYTILFVLACFTPEAFVGIAFDSGGATTGPMTVPFIMALGLGVSTVRSDEDGSFGLTGVTSIGPIFATLAYALFLQSGGAAADSAPGAGVEQIADQTLVSQMFSPLFEAFRHSVVESVASILPLFGLFILFRIFFLRLTWRQSFRLGLGLFYAFAGLSIFLAGVNGGFMQAGKELGMALGAKAAESGGLWYALLLLTGLALGAVIVCAEPAVWVLSEQVEQVSGGTIRRKGLLLFLAISSAIAVALALWRATEGFHVGWLLTPGYLLAMALLYFSPPLFSGIAFDSGGVASGPLTSTFVLSFTLGAAERNGAENPFGVVALVAMMPLIAIQLMGIIFNRKRCGAHVVSNAVNMKKEVAR